MSLSFHRFSSLHFLPEERGVTVGNNKKIGALTDVGEHRARNFFLLLALRSQPITAPARFRVRVGLRGIFGGRFGNGMNFPAR